MKTSIGVFRVSSVTNARTGSFVQKNEVERETRRATIEVNFVSSLDKFQKALAKGKLPKSKVTKSKLGILVHSSREYDSGGITTINSVRDEDLFATLKEQGCDFDLGDALDFRPGISNDSDIYFVGGLARLEDMPLYETDAYGLATSASVLDSKEVTEGDLYAMMLERLEYLVARDRFQDAKAGKKLLKDFSKLAPKTKAVKA